MGMHYKKCSRSTTRFPGFSFFPMKNFNFMPQTNEKPRENKENKPKLQEKCSFPQYYGREILSVTYLCVCFLCIIKPEKSSFFPLK